LFISSLKRMSGRNKKAGRRTPRPFLLSVNPGL
jgi:hypothetical protein